MDFRLPNNSERVTVVGRTGSGKTVFGMWLLSRSQFDKQPHIVVDYKLDENINAIDRIKEIGLNEKIPTKAGLYIIHPRGSIDEDAVDKWLWNIWATENIGLYVDEGYSIPDKGGLEAIYTQGRSKHIPIITLSQRPAWISRYVFSEADYYSVFHLNDERDKQTIGRFTPWGTRAKPLPEYHSRWFDVKSQSSFYLQPVPKVDEIQNRISDRLGPSKKVY
jgi:hypothetical protein